MAPWERASSRSRDGELVGQSDVPERAAGEQPDAADKARDGNVWTRALPLIRVFYGLQVSDEDVTFARACQR